NIREVTRFIIPSERSAVGRADHLENMAWSCRRIRIESSDRRVTNGSARCCWIERDVEDRSIREHGIGASYVDPSRLFGTCSKPKPDLNIPVVGPDYHSRLQR